MALLLAAYSLAAFAASAALYRDKAASGMTQWAVLILLGLTWPLVLSAYAVFRLLIVREVAIGMLPRGNRSKGG